MYGFVDGAVIHFKDNEPYKDISFMENAKVFKVKEDEGKITENVQKMYSLL